MLGWGDTRSPCCISNKKGARTVELILLTFSYYTKILISKSIISQKCAGTPFLCVPAEKTHFVTLPHLLVDPPSRTLFVYTC